MIYFSMKFFELGFAMCNLFELATEEDLKRVPDAIFLYGTPVDETQKPVGNETIFFDDKENNIMVASVPCRDEFAYFGYLKKMALTLHNIIMLKRGRLPYHGAMFRIAIRDVGESTFVVIGDTGAGKSETLEAFRSLAKDDVEDITIIADDMGSLEIGPNGELIGYGTEMGAFVRLDDLQSGYALGQIDRAIIMNADQVNARVVLPVTKYDDVIKGYPVDYVFYANNYDIVDEDHTVIHRFESVETALDVFRSGAVMSKGTTTSTGLVKSFYANIFGPAQYPELQEELAKEFYKAMFQRGIFVGELRTQLAVPGMEHKGPEQAAKELLKAIRSRAEKQK
jgi:energy-coupling factor transporter ATP-binding protein EcfA2